MKTNQEKFTWILYGKKILVGLFPIQLNTKQLLRAFCRNKSHSCTLPLIGRDSALRYDRAHNTRSAEIDVMVGSPSQSHGEHMNYFWISWELPLTKGVWVSPIQHEQRMINPASIYWIRKRMFAYRTRVWTMCPETVIRRWQAGLLHFIIKTLIRETAFFHLIFSMHAYCTK